MEQDFGIALSDSSTVFVCVDAGNLRKTDEAPCEFLLTEKVDQNRKLLSNTTMRRLVIEMFTVYDKCQKATDIDKIATTCCTFSRTYRSILLNAASMSSNEHLMRDFALWSLYEKLHFGRSDGSICADLISWANESFSFVKTQVEASANAYQPHDGGQSDEYWLGVIVSILCCHFDECTQLLSMIKGNPGVDLFIDTLSFFHVEDLMDEAKIDKVREWKEIMRENLEFGKYGADQNLIFLTKILLGDDKYLAHMATKVLTEWWHFLPFYVLVKNPYSNYKEFLELAHQCRSTFVDEDDEEKKEELDEFWCLIARDDGNFQQLIMQNPWLAVHLVDLIYKSTLDPELVRMRQNHIMSYASMLISHSDLWEIGAGYLISCGAEGLLRLESHIEALHIDDDEMAEALYEICCENRLEDSKLCVSNTMTFRYLKMNEWSAALGWALKSASKKTIDSTVSRIVSQSSKEELASLTILGSISSNSVLALPSLTFLYSYQRFVKMMHCGEVMDCVQQLIPLIMMPDVPTQYYYDLFDYLIMIIKEDSNKNGIRFSKNILYELSSFLATFSVDKSNDLNENFTKKLNTLKKMVMLKLADSIVKGY